MKYYRQLRRTRDRFDQIVHLKDPMTLQLSLCASGFSTNGLDVDVRSTAVPTCLWCVAGTWCGLPYWSLDALDSPRRLTIETLNQII